MFVFSYLFGLYWKIDYLCDKKRTRRASYSVTGRADGLRPFLFFISATITSAMTIKTSNQIRLIHGDCMDYMRSLPDNAFDLAIVDPPYGIGVDKDMRRKANTKAGKSLAKRADYHSSDWDKCAPSEVYFTELRRVSRNQIVWGATTLYPDFRLIALAGLYGIKTTVPMILRTANWLGPHSERLCANSSGVGKECCRKI